MVNNQKMTTLNHERVTGERYGSTLGGQYYANLENYVNHVEEFVKNSQKDKYLIADIGGGSGIVGCSLLRKVLSLGCEAELDVLDINSKQLEGVIQEAEKAGVPRELIFPKEFDILIDIPKSYDFACMRKVLHYFDEETNKQVIDRLPRFLKECGTLVIGALCEPTPFQAEYRTMILNEIERIMHHGKIFHRRYVASQRRLEEQLRNAGFAVLDSFGEYYERLTPEMMKDKWGINDEDVDRIETLGSYEDFSINPTTSMADIEFCSRLREVRDSMTGKTKIVVGNPYLWRSKVFVCEKLK